MISVAGATSITEVASTTAFAKVAAANAISRFRVVGQEWMMGRRIDRAIPADPRPSSILGLAHRFSLSIVFQDVAQCDEQQECNQRSDDQ